MSRRTLLLLGGNDSSAMLSDTNSERTTPPWPLGPRIACTPLPGVPCFGHHVPEAPHYPPRLRGAIKLMHTGFSCSAQSSSTCSPVSVLHRDKNDLACYSCHNVNSLTLYYEVNYQVTKVFVSSHDSPYRTDLSLRIASVMIAGVLVDYVQAKSSY